MPLLRARSPPLSRFALVGAGTHPTRRPLPFLPYTWRSSPHPGSRKPRGGGKGDRVDEGCQGPRTRNPLPCPLLTQVQLRCLKVTADTLRRVLHPKTAQLPLPSLPILLALAARRGSGQEPQTVATPPSVPKRQPETREGLWTAKPVGEGEGSGARPDPGEGSLGWTSQLPAPLGSCCISYEIPS